MREVMERVGKKLGYVSLVIMMILLTIGILPTGGVVKAESRKLDAETDLTDLIVTVTQGGATIPESGTMTTDEIAVNISFGVPVEGDELPVGTIPVKKNDWVEFALSDAFTLVASDPIPLYNGGLTTGLKIGTVSFITDSTTKMVTAKVTFDGDDETFDGTSNAVTAQFKAKLKYDASGSPATGETKTIQILGKTYTVTVPALPIDYSVTKTGVPNLADQTITWTVNIAATQGGTPIDLAEYSFSDDLAAVGEYVAASFQVGDTAETLADVSPTAVFDGTVLSYSFPADSDSPKVVKFKTKIKDEAYYASGEQTVRNTAKLLSGETEVGTGSVDVKFTPKKWIEKTGVTNDTGSTGVYEPTNRTITWTIIANHNAATLNGVVITDVLPNGLTFDSATWQKWDEGTNDWATEKTEFSEVPTEGKYNIGDINSKILLTIVTKVPDSTNTTGIKNYSNSASITWDNGPSPGIGSGGFTVPIGYNAITKSGEVNTANQTVRWTVNVDTKGQTIPGMKVYDLLVYGKSDSINLDTATGIPTGIAPADLTSRYGQKYVTDSFTGSGEVTVTPIFQATRRVADLLEINTLSQTEANSFSFDSQVLDPAIFAGNKKSTVRNTASLFSGTAKLNAATAEVNYTNNMLSKDMLKRGTTLTAAGINAGLTTNASEGFDYVDKAAIFRLSVNADGIDLTNTSIDAAGGKLGDVTLTDTLPEGWEFVEIIPGSGTMYQIFAGTQDSGKIVEATGDALNTVTGLTTDFNNLTRTGTFTFTQLDQPYVILVKAKPTDETAKEYFNSNNTTTVTNTVALKNANWTPGVSDSQTVRIQSEILGKTAVLQKAGELLWTVDYKPYDLDQGGQHLEDQLPLGIDLRLDANGNLVVDGNIAVKALTLQADGTYTEGSNLPLVLGENVHYNNTERILGLDIPDPTKAYRFTYLTDITGEPGSVSNKVSLIGSGIEQGPLEKPYFITAADGSASLQRNGWIEITKTKEDGTVLSGAEFTLYATDGTTVIKKGITLTDGKVKLKVIPDGSYILKETKAPTGYALEGVSHSLVVRTVGTTVSSSIDGKNGTDSNKLTVKNFTVGTAGNLTISKTVAGVSADKAKLFDFILTLTDATGATVTGSYVFVGEGIAGGTIASGGTISLTHDQRITILGLPKGATYAMTEEDYSDDGYTTTSTSETGTIQADTTEIAAFTNTRTIGNLTISKTVAGNAADTTKAFSFTLTLGGNGAAKTYLYRGTGVPDGTITSGDNISLAHGQSITIMDLPQGATYMVAEADYAADGYTTTKTGDTGSIVAETTKIASFTNTRNININPTKGSVRLQKIDGENNERLAGGIFNLVAKNGTLIKDNLTTDEKGQIFLDELLFGEYSFIEIEAPEGYVLDSTTIPFEINLLQKDMIVIAENDKIIKDQIILKKKDVDSKAGLSGCEITVFDEAGEEVRKEETGADGNITIKNLPVGTYTFKETKAPTGYILNPEIYTFTINIDGTIEGNQTIYDAITKITLKKGDLATQIGLPGCEITIFNSLGKEVAREITGADGTISIKGLPVGNYTYRETKAPIGYKINNETYRFTIEADGTLTGDQVFYDEVTKVTLRKFDAETKNPLAGAEFTVFNALGEEVHRAMTGADGRISIKGLPVGEYTFKETKVPTGYQAVDQTYSFAIGLDGVVTGEMLVENQPIPEEKPGGGGDGPNTPGTDPNTPGTDPNTPGNDSQTTVIDQLRRGASSNNPRTGISDSEMTALVGISLLGLAGLSIFKKTKRKTAKK